MVINKYFNKRHYFKIETSQRYTDIFSLILLEFGYLKHFYCVELIVSAIWLHQRLAS